MQRPLVSLIVLNYNGRPWLERCIDSIRQQTIFTQCELLVADNISTDGSNDLGRKLLANLPNARFIQHSQNEGYCQGNNLAAAQATGEYLWFLNNDLWLEPDCLEILLRETKANNAAAAGPLVLNYADNSFQSLGAFGFDIFGLATARHQCATTSEVFMPEGCSYLIRKDLFDQLGGFDPVIFMYADEMDLSVRAWVTGHKIIAVPAARLHHRGAADANPEGGASIVEFRTSDTKRFYANRNNLMVLLKNGRNILLLLALLQIFVLFPLEFIAGVLLVRRWRFVRRSYIDPLSDCWRLRGHITAERRKINTLRKRSDLWMLRFLRLRLNRWDEAIRIRKYGLPKVSAK
jgi:GT2 family glycosyltransferase